MENTKNTDQTNDILEIISNANNIKTPTPNYHQSLCAYYVNNVRRVLIHSKL
jgi:hypothetical protein